MSLHEQMKPLQHGQGFASLKYVDDFLETGKLPDIHKDIGVVISAIPAHYRVAALDLGACHGLLSVRAASIGFTTVIGWETDERSVAVFNQFIRPRVPGVELHTARLDVTTNDFALALQRVARERGVNTIVARRVFPELFSDTFGKAGLEEATWRAAGAAFSAACRAANIRYIAVEGRVWTENKTYTNPLCNLAKEIEALGSHWHIEHVFKNCALLRRA